MEIRVKDEALLSKFSVENPKSDQSLRKMYAPKKNQKFLMKFKPMKQKKGCRFQNQNKRKNKFLLIET